MSAIFTGTKMRINVVRDYICFDKTRRDTQIRIYDDCLFSICVKNQISIFLQIYRIVILFTFLIIKERERERERERGRERDQGIMNYISALTYSYSRIKMNRGGIIKSHVHFVSSLFIRFTTLQSITRT